MMGAAVALYDQHLHSWFSNDSDADPAENVRQALAVGLAGLSITDHFDTHPAEWPMCRYDYDGIAAAVAALRGRFGDRIYIGHGIEVCYQPEQMGWVLPFLESHRFDVVLLSVHWFGARALHFREHWEGLDASAGTRAYLEAVLQAARFALGLKRQGSKPFDILGHLDLVKRYTHRYFGTFEVRAQAEIIDEILRTCLQADLVPEVNLSSLRQSLTEPMPAEWVVCRYAELGGEAMALGSDAHSAEHVGAGVAEGAAMLRRQGIRRLAVFNNRCRCDVDL
jgi:histidinol-phosphatase (PHP family)